MATRTKDETDATEAPPPRSGERSRAADYLDLWERQVTISAVHGPAPLPPIRLPSGARRA